MSRCNPAEFRGAPFAVPVGDVPSKAGAKSFSNSVVGIVLKRMKSGHSDSSQSVNGPTSRRNTSRAIRGRPLSRALLQRRLQSLGIEPWLRRDAQPRLELRISDSFVRMSGATVSPRTPAAIDATKRSTSVCRRSRSATSHSLKGVEYVLSNRHRSTLLCRRHIRSP
jgi:hypothetical protein